MKLKKFRQIIRELQESHDTMGKLYDYVRPETFEHHNTVISELLIEIYGEPAVTFILDEWLSGNQSPIVFTADDGTTTEMPVTTEYYLWKVMEHMKSPGERLEKKAPVKVWDELEEEAYNHDNNS